MGMNGVGLETENVPIAVQTIRASMLESELMGTVGFRPPALSKEFMRAQAYPLGDGRPTHQVDQGQFESRSKASGAVSSKSDISESPLD
jgi:hypothetical protein